MNPITHFLMGWSLANAAKIERRDRLMVTVSAVAADLDGLGLVAELGAGPASSSFHLYSEYHHLLFHNIGFAFLVGTAALLFARRRFVVLLLGLASFHLHLLGDIVGSRGPDGYPWPIPYLMPFSKSWPISWNGQWELNAWPNFLLTILFLGLTLYLAWRRGFSPLEIFSPSLDRSFVAILRKRLKNSCQNERIQE